MQHRHPPTRLSLSHLIVDVERLQPNQIIPVQRLVIGRIYWNPSGIGRSASRRSRRVCPKEARTVKRWIKCCLELLDLILRGPAMERGIAIPQSSHQKGQQRESSEMTTPAHTERRERKDENTVGNLSLGRRLVEIVNMLTRKSYELNNQCPAEDTRRRLHQHAYLTS